jgi:carboxypeptidase Q
MHPRLASAIFLAACLTFSAIRMQAEDKPETTPQAIAVTPETQAALVKLGGQMMVAGKAYEYDRELADEIGPRLTGSANYVKATDWAVAEFTRLGLARVHKESWEIPATWEPETLATAEMLTPHRQRLHLESEGWSPSTPEGGIKGKVFYLDALTPEGVKAAAASIKGAIVLVDGQSLEAEKDERFGRIFDAIHSIGKNGAIGLILGIGTTNNAPSMIGLTDFNGSLTDLPSGNLGQEDTLLLKRLLEKGPVEIAFRFKNRIREHVKVDNVVAEIPGREANGEFVVVGGHLDSWDPGTGAQDNGTGAASVVAVAEAIKASGLTPRRTIRFVLFGGEEEGLLGSVHYGRDHLGEMEKCAGVFVTDTGAEPPTGWYIFGREDEKASLKTLKPWLDQLGAGASTDEGQLTFETDEAPFLIHGVPSFVLWTPMEKYMRLHHKPSDTFDKVNQRDLNLGAATVGLTAYAFADATTSLKHLSTAELEKQLKEIKIWTQYQDLDEHKLF